MKKSAKLSVAMSSIAVLLVGLLGVVYAATSTSGSGSSALTPAAAGGGTADATVTSAAGVKTGAGSGSCTAADTGDNFTFALGTPDAVVPPYTCTITVAILNQGLSPMKVLNINNTFGNGNNAGAYYVQNVSGCSVSSLGTVNAGASVNCVLVYTANFAPATNDTWLYEIAWQPA